MKAVTIQQMRDIEKAADLAGISYSKMIVTAGINLGRWIDQKISSNHSKVVLGIIGSGNNGGDTLVALSYLATHGWFSIAFIASPRSEEDLLLKDFLCKGGKVVLYNEDPELRALATLIYYADVLLDGIIGIGFKKTMKLHTKKILQVISAVIINNARKPSIIAVDCPSGVDCDTGEVSDVILQADYTACMGAVKLGLLKFPAFKYCGEIVNISIGLPEDFLESAEVTINVIDDLLASKLLPYRNIDSHKGSFGKCLIFAGSESFPGAALLSGRSAYSSGTGIVELLADPWIRNELSSQMPEVIWANIPASDTEISDLLKTKLEQCSSVLIGPGIGQSERTETIFNKLIYKYIAQKNRQPLLIDADGLRLLSRIEDWFKILDNDVILTPHPGEFSALTGLSINEIQKDRVTSAGHYALKWQKIIVLKGAITVIAEPDGKITCMPVASSALATAGTGDVLAGLISGFCAQSLNPSQAVKLGVYTHAMAGKLAESKKQEAFSIVASEIISTISEVLSNLNRTAGR